MGEREEERPERGFTVVDRRGAGPEEAPAPAAEAPPRQPREPRELPQVDFSSFCVSLGTSVLYHLGAAPDPHGGAAPEPDLPMAQHTIDLLDMLQQKTRGNLDEEEAKLLDGLLYELRMRFLEVRRAASARGGGEG
jgi:hypothetical protein